MAFAVSSIKNSVFGDLRVVLLNVTPDSAEGAVAVPGGGSIVFHQWAKVGGTASMSCMVVRENLGTTGTVAAGSLGISNAVNAGVYKFVVYMSS